MITTLIGNNEYLLKAKLGELVDKFKENNDQLAVEKIELDQIDFDEFKQSLLNYSLFSESRLVILDQPSVNKLFAESIEEIVNSLPETTQLIIVEPNIDKRLVYYKFLQKTNLIDCQDLNEAKLISWVVEEAKRLKGTINSSEAKYLIERVGPNQLLISHELEKLVLYNDKIDKQTIDLLTEPSPSSTIFQLLDAAFNNQSKLALSIYIGQRKLKVQPEQILSMFVWQLQIIALCLSAQNQNISELASKTKTSPYSLGKAMQIAKRLDLNSLKRMVGNLLNIDYLSKTISYDLDQALQNFIIETAISS